MTSKEQKNRLLSLQRTPSRMSIRHNRKNIPAQEALTQKTPDLTEISIYQILLNKRQELNLETDDIAAYLKIKLRDVEAIESGNLDKMSLCLYVPGLIRSYGKFLKIDAKLIEQKIKLLPIESNVNNKKHQLLNIGENIDLTPTKESLVNFLVISALLFLTLLSIYNFYENKSAAIDSDNLIEEFKKIDL